MKNFNNKYTIRDFIDKNKWSNVYMAINKETNEQIVINILINVEGNEENLENFKREVNLLEDINNPNVICINEISTYMNKDKVYYYIESENFEGLTLDELMRINKLNEDQCLQIIREVINGVKAFNNQKINFKNLTVENIIINGEGVVKIDTLSFINNHKGHINCEIYNPKKFDTHEDVYAIGSILCEMITGEKLFNKEEHKDLDKNIVEILEKSTNKKHISRYKYKDLSEFLDDVNLYLDGGEISEKSAINFEKIHKLNPSPKVKKYMAIGCCGVVLLCSTAFGAQYLINKNNNNMETTNTSEDIDKTEESPETNKIEAITPTEENLITPQNSSENDKEETTDNNKNDENNNNENMNDQNNNHDNNHEDNDKDNNTDKENPDKDDPDKDDNKDENEDGNKDEPEQNPDDNDDKENPDEENPDNDNSNEEKPDQNPNEDQNGDKNNENTTQDSENK
ncbi:MAG: protein kinase [Terrisporobacter othiniensis]|uniref:protein kinase domain-containing protein n=1 Tax=Terrisporobacter othiniensis TaxID=1577792 RepID=UPI000944EC12|nr:protein kinase [Terrisporobacter othiniensis]MDY3372311.1 protein kinase [Terrisporobacter othiniensis]